MKSFHRYTEVISREQLKFPPGEPCVGLQSWPKDSEIHAQVGSKSQWHASVLTGVAALPAA